MSERVPYDFSGKSNILLEDEDGLRVPMSEPYFRSWEIAPKTWRILSDGDFSYLLDGEDGDALLIDSGYGAGSIRAYCEGLVGHPVTRIANTHDHFDHTANNGYFDLAYMAEETAPLATQPFRSFAGIWFPADYPKRIVGDGDTIPIKGRDLAVFKIPDHAAGSIVMLDKAFRLLFVGDELGMPFGKPLHGTVENWLRLLEKLIPFRGDYDGVWGGNGYAVPDVVEGQAENCRRILAGEEGVPDLPPMFNTWQQTDEAGHIIWKRRLPHPGDGGNRGGPDESAFKRRLGEGMHAIYYDIRQIRDGQKG